MNRVKTEIQKPRTSGFGCGVSLIEKHHQGVIGEVFAELIHPNGERERVLEKKNIYTLDGGILAAMYFAGETINPVSMLAIGNGATGSIVSPDVADNRQRKLNNEIYRKPFSSVIYRAADGSESSVPTNVLDLTTVFTETEASGAGLTEMGLLSTKSLNNSVTTPNTDVFPTRTLTTDLREYDILLNYITFPVIHKLQGSVLALTWRLTF
jgi:hypothetical protein